MLVSIGLIGKVLAHQHSLVSAETVQDCSWQAATAGRCYLCCLSGWVSDLKSGHRPILFTKVAAISMFKTVTMNDSSARRWHQSSLNSTLVLPSLQSRAVLTWLCTSCETALPYHVCHQKSATDLMGHWDKLMAWRPTKELQTLHAFFRDPQATGNCEVGGVTGRGESPQTCSASDMAAPASPTGCSQGWAGCALTGSSSLLALYVVTKAGSRTGALRVVFSSVWGQLDLHTELLC